MKIDYIINKIKQYEKRGMEISLIVKNLNTKEVGVASLTKDGNMAIFEGDDDGKDDKIYLLHDFVKNYEIIRIENQYEEELE